MGVEDLVIPFTNKVYLDAIIIPAGLLVAGVYIVKPDYVVYAAAVTAALSAFKYKRMREWPFTGELILYAQTLLRPLTPMCRTKEDPQTCRIPGVRADRKDCPFTQYCYVGFVHGHMSSSCPRTDKSVFTAIGSLFPTRPPSSVSQSVNTSRLVNIFPRKMAHPKRLSAPTHLSLVTTNPVISTFSSSPTQPETSQSLWLRSPLARRSA